MTCNEFSGPLFLVCNLQKKESETRQETLQIINGVKKFLGGGGGCFVLMMDKFHLQQITNRDILHSSKKKL